VVASCSFWEVTGNVLLEQVPLNTCALVPHCWRSPSLRGGARTGASLDDLRTQTSQNIDGKPGSVRSW
jgi:hypothetical protein